MKFIYWIIHIFGCPDNEIMPDARYNGSIGICSKCGRTYFIFKKY